MNAAELENLINTHGLKRVIPWAWFEARLAFHRAVPGFVVVNLKVKDGVINSFTMEFTGLLRLAAPWINGRVNIIDGNARHTAFKGE